MISNLSDLTAQTNQEPEEKDKVIMQKPKRKFFDIFYEEFTKSFIRVILFILQILAVIIVILFLLNIFLQRTQPVSNFFQKTFNDLTYKAYLITHPNSAPSHGTVDGKPLLSFPIIDEIRYVKSNELFYENAELKISLTRIELSPDAQYDVEKYYAVLQREFNDPNIWDNLTDFLGKEKKVYAHQVLSFDGSYWFIYKIEENEVVFGHFVEEIEAKQFPVVWEIK